MGASANPKISSPASAGIFHAVYPGSEAGRAMATFAISKPGTTKVALAMHSDDWAHGYCDPAAAYVKDHGGEIVATTTLEHGATDATAQALQIKASGAQAVMGCLYQPELVVLLRDLQKYQVNAVVMGALGADFDQVLAAFPSHDWLQGHFFQPYQFKSKLGTGPLKKFHDIFVKYLTKDELPKTGEPTNFYYYGVPVAIVAVEAFRRAGPNPTRESWEKAVEVAEGFRYRRAGRYRDLRAGQPCRRPQDVRGGPGRAGAGDCLQDMGRPIAELRLTCCPCCRSLSSAASLPECSTPSSRCR